MVSGPASPNVSPGAPPPPPAIPRTNPIFSPANPSRGIAWRRRAASDRVAIPVRERRWRVPPGSDPDAQWGSPVDRGFAYVWRLENALHRFRGVATRYLPHYLLWFRLVDAPRPRAQTVKYVIAGRFP